MSKTGSRVLLEPTILKAAHTDFEIYKTLLNVKLLTVPTDLTWKLMTCNVQQLM
jgi:hypothetical protein